MEYAPHFLQIQVADGEEYTDTKGIRRIAGEEWLLLCTCRCDDNDAREVIAVNGVAREYSYHVVYDPTEIEHKFVIGERVRILCEDGSIRGEGMVIKPARNNFLDYAELYL